MSFFSLSISVFLESLKHLIDVIWILQKQENQTNTMFLSEHSHGLIARPHVILGIGLYATLSSCLLAFAMFDIVVKRSIRIKKHLKQRRPSLKQPLPKDLVSKSCSYNFLVQKQTKKTFISIVLITDTLPINQSYLQIFNMLLGPIVILICGILLIVFSERDHIRNVYSRLVDPIICCILFLIYLFVIFNPSRRTKVR